LKPASKAPGLHGVFVRGTGFELAIADCAFKRMQVDARTCQFDTDEHHRCLALWTGGATNCSERNDGRQALRLGHDASPRNRREHNTLCHRQMPRRRGGDDPSMCLQGSQTPVNSRACWRKMSSEGLSPRETHHLRKGRSTGIAEFIIGPTEGRTRWLLRTMRRAARRRNPSRSGICSRIARALLE
jgi:hypothetical protein